MPSAASTRLPRTDARLERYPASLYALAAALLAFEILPLGVLLWTASTGGTGLVPSTQWVNIALTIAVAAAAASVVPALWAADSPTRPAGWPLLIGVLLLPVVGAMFLLAGPLAAGSLHVRPWLLALLGIVNGQMAAAACLRHAAASIPASRFRAAALDCIRPGQRLYHVVVPACAPALALLIAQTFVGTWSALLLAFAVGHHPELFALGAGNTPGNYVTAVYVFASIPMIFLGLWTIRACLTAPAAPRPFARA